MDIATIAGLLLSLCLVLLGIFLDPLIELEEANFGQFAAFFDFNGIIIVVGCTMFATLTSEKLSVFLAVWKVALKAFIAKTMSVDQTLDKLIELVKIVRKDGLLALENVEIEDPFLAKGVRLAVDGLPAAEVRMALQAEMRSLRERHKTGRRLFKFMEKTAPSMGMVGTLIGLVKMLQNMQDPTAIGPAMSVALLTTLYGAVLAFMVFGPLAEKLEIRTKDETKNMAVILAGLESVLNAENPRFIREKLESYLAPHEREKKDGPEPAAQEVDAGQATPAEGVS